MHRYFEVSYRWRKAGGVLAAVGILIGGAGLCGQQEPAAARPARTWTNPARRAVETAGRHGISLQSLYVHDLTSAPAGAGRGWHGRYSWDFGVVVDGEKAAGVKGLSGALHVRQHMREYGAPWEAPAQGYSNIDAGNFSGVYEAWAQQVLGAGRVRLKAGRIDANTEFDAVATAADFLNSSMGYSPTIMEFPTYPNPKAGAMGAVAVGEKTQVSAGVFRACRGRIAVAEAARTWRAGRQGAGGRAAAGGWWLKEPLSRFDGSLARGSRGFYAVLEQNLNAASEKEERQTAAFLQLGTGDGRENLATQHLGAGAVVSAPWRARAADGAGVAVSWMRVSRERTLGGGATAGAELVAEGYYKLRLPRGMMLVADLQYFRHPGALRGKADALVATPRLVKSF